jgi:CheY-like chemotaxis protein
MNTNVLVAEPSSADWAAIAKGISRHLPEASVLRVKDGEQALRFLFHRGLLTSEPAVPDLVLLSEELPLIPAAGVIARMRIDPRTRQTPVIVLRRDPEEESLDPYWDGEIRSAMLTVQVTEALELRVAEAVDDLYRRYPPLPERQKGLSFRQ